MSNKYSRVKQKELNYYAKRTVGDRNKYIS